jgi:diguanylate cyclase (GGDEF)-like protein/PAS domain S-box-containing protein
MDTIFAELLEQATLPGGEIDADKLGALVGAKLKDADRLRQTTDRSINAMVGELDRLKQKFEALACGQPLGEGEDALRAQFARFEAAINYMSQGLVMFDADGRVQFCNTRYLQMYKLTSEMAEPGSSVADLLRHRIASGTFSGDPDKYAEEVLARFAVGNADSRIVELSDGRTIAISNRTTPHGGWVATHEDITERRRAENQVAHLARHDPLTDLPNRMLFREKLTDALAHTGRGQQLAVLYLDLDHFKTVNDTLGHPIGDELLRTVAERLRGCLRETDMAARIGGDEFAIVQTGINAPANAAVLARRLRDTICAPYNLNGHAAVIDTSIGIALAPSDGTTPDAIMKNADMALYRAKGDGRGVYRFFEPEMDAHMQKRRSLELAMRNALQCGEFELYYQPVINVADNTVSACEALIRWHHPERGLILPADFIPLAEEIGMIVPIGEWVIRRACADAASWPRAIKVAVNLSPTQLLNANLMAVIQEALATAQLPADRLEVEITEAVLMQSTEATLASLRRLRNLGVQIALDDFGTGYSSLSYLRRFPFDKLKIDRSFIGSLGEGTESINIVRAVAGLARSLDMTTTAEGVETEDQFEQIRELGCTQLQGYLISPPVPLRDLARLFIREVAAQRGAA